MSLKDLLESNDGMQFPRLLVVLSASTEEVDPLDEFDTQEEGLDYL